MNDPEDESKRTINSANQAFIRRVGNILGGKNILKEIGFVDELGLYKLKEVDLKDIRSWMTEINDAILMKL